MIGKLEISKIEKSKFQNFITIKGNLIWNFEILIFWFFDFWFFDFLIFWFFDFWFLIFDFWFLIFDFWFLIFDFWFFDFSKFRNFDFFDFLKFENLLLRKFSFYSKDLRYTNFQKRKLLLHKSYTRVTRIYFFWKFV